MEVTSRIIIPTHKVSVEEAMDYVYKEYMGRVFVPWRPLQSRYIFFYFTTF